MTAQSKRVNPALAHVAGKSIADQTRAIQAAAAAPAIPAPLPASSLTPRELTFRASWESPVTGLVETHEIVSRVPMGDEHARMARTAVAFAGGTPLDMFSAPDREYFQAQGRAFVQIRDPSDRVRELLYEPAFLFAVVGRLVEHERRFQLRGRSPSDGAPPQPSVVVHAPWDPDDAAGE